MHLSVKSNIDKILRDMKGKAAKIKKVISDEINTTAFQARKEENSEIDKAFDKPTPATQKAVIVKKSTAKTLLASVYISNKRRQNEFLEKQVEGGKRKPKKKTLLAPTKKGGNKNRYGNIPRGKIARLLENKKKYFSGQPKGVAKYGSNPPAGVWQRMGRKGDKKLRLLVSYSKTQRYKKRFRFYEVGKKSVRNNFHRNFAKGMSKLNKG
jgi:hypothetical protein